MGKVSNASEDNCCGMEQTVAATTGSKSGRAKAASSSSHPSHASQLVRLNRMAGQLEGVRRMIEQRRYCPEILTQTRAVASALKMIEMKILETHLRHCVSGAMMTKDRKKAQDKIEELVSVLARF